MVFQVPIAVALLVRNGRVLLGHRHPARQRYPDRWDLVGGHVESGELPREAVVRECLEELGIRVHDPLPIPLESSVPTLHKHAFLVTHWDGKPINAAPEEHDELRWFLPDSLADLQIADPSNLPGILRAISIVSG